MIINHWILVLLPIMGLAVGSFIGLVSVRLPAGDGVVAGRSRCRGCDRTLGPGELVPVFSYLLQRGRCRGCGAVLGPRYPLSELACAGIGLWAALHHGGPAAFLTAGFGWSLLLVALVDAEHFWLPDVFTLPLLGAGLLVAAITEPEALPHRVAGALIGFATLWLLAAAYRRLRGREGLGGGDPRLFAAIGAWVGWMGLPTVLLWACAAGFSVVAGRIAARRPVSGADQLPFGVFLAIGAWFTWLYGPLGL